MNGPGFRTTMPTTEFEPTHPNYRQPAGIPWRSETHAGEDVAAYASGRGAENVRGVMDQNELFEVMRKALGI